MFQRLSVKVTSLNMMQPHSYVSSFGSSFHYGRNDFFVSGTLFRYVSSIFWVECKPLVAAGWLVTLHSCRGGDGCEWRLRSSMYWTSFLKLCSSLPLY